MRKIEQQMLAAIQQRKNWNKYNTEVYWNSAATTCFIYLHNNRIAVLDFNPDDSLRDHYLNHCGWKTPTTASRLRAIINQYNLPALTIKNGQWLLGESPW